MLLNKTWLLKFSVALMIFGVAVNYEQFLTLFDFKGWYLGWLMSIMLLAGQFKLTRSILLVATAAAIPTAIALAMGTYSSSKGIFIFAQFVFMMIYARALVQALGHEVIIRLYAKGGVVFAALVIANEFLYLMSPTISTAIFGDTEPVAFITRAQGLFLEPSEAALYLTPALAYYLLKLDRGYFLFVFAAMLATFSSLTYIALALCFTLGILIRKIGVLKLIFLVATLVAIITVAAVSPQIMERIDTISSIPGAAGFEFQNYNSSIATIIMNSIVAKDSLLGSNFIGIGFGNFGYGFNTYAEAYFPLGYSGEGLFWNRETGGSLLLRVTAELGVIGLALVAYVLYRLFKAYAVIRHRNCANRTHMADVQTYIVTAIVMFVISLLRKDSLTNVHLFVFVVGGLMLRIDAARQKAYVPALQPKAA